MYFMFLCLYIVLLTAAGVGWEAGDSYSMASTRSHGLEYTEQMYSEIYSSSINAVPTIYQMKSKIPPEWKIRLHKQGTEDQRETTGSSEESDGQHEFEFSPNQLLHLHQTLPYLQKQHKNSIFQQTPNRTQ